MTSNDFLKIIEIDEAINDIEHKPVEKVILTLYSCICRFYIGRIDYKDVIENGFRLLEKYNIQLVTLNNIDIISVNLMRYTIYDFNTRKDDENEYNPYDSDVILLYQILKSLGNRHIGELNNLKVIYSYNIINTGGNIRINSEIYTFNLLKKQLKIALIRVLNEKSGLHSIGNGFILETCIELLTSQLGSVFYKANKLNRIYGTIINKILTHKITIYSLMKILECAIINKLKIMGNLEKIELEDLLFEPIEVAEISESIKNQIIMALCFTTVETEISPINTYNKILKNKLTTLRNNKITNNDKEDHIEEFENINKLEEVKLKREIRELRKNIYNLKEERNKVKNLDEVIEEYEITEEYIKEELKASEVINIYSKFNLLKNKKILILSGISLNQQLYEYFDVEDALQFKGKSINKDYDYVVKVTKGIDHGIGYDINSEVKKTNAKMITTSRTNINLILDDIIAQM